MDCHALRARNDGGFVAMTESFFSELQLADAADGTIVCT